MDRKRKKRETPVPMAGNPDLEARRRAAVIFEVMGGLRTPVEAAKELGMSLPRYYAQEKRALEGLVAACAAPRKKGRQRSPAKEMDRLREQVKRLEQEASRNLAMARAAQRAAGFAASAPAAKAKEDGKKQRKRRPMTRALAAARALRGEPAVTAAMAAVMPASPSRSDSRPAGVAAAAPTESISA